MAMADNRSVTEEPRDPSRVSTPIVRVRQGRRLGGVCTGLHEVLGIGTAWLRLGFVLAALCGGVGIVIYLACWTIVPTDAMPEPQERNSGATIIGWTVTGLVLVALLAILGATATLFGLGWLVFALSAVVLVVLLRQRSAARRLAALAVLCSLALPAVAVGVSSSRLAIQTGSAYAAPATVGQLQSNTYRTGLGTLLVDLRHTQLPASGRFQLHIDAGLRRTIVALPHQSCVHVVVHYRINTFPLRVAALLSGHQQALFSGVVLFGQTHATGPDAHTTGTSISPNPAAVGPTLVIDFSSQGGSLFVRDYPITVQPELDPNWPGFAAAYIEPRPHLNGEPPRARRYMLEQWRLRRAAQIASIRRINSLMPGPCET